jgi:hypothetical protein
MSDQNVWNMPSRMMSASEFGVVFQNASVVDSSAGLPDIKGSVIHRIVSGFGGLYD